MKTRSLDLKMSKREVVAYIFGLSRWRWVQADPLPDSTGSRSLLHSPTRFSRCWRFWLALKNKQIPNFRQKYDLKVWFHLMKHWEGASFCPLRAFKHDADVCTLDRQAVSWLMVCAWVLIELCNNMLDHLLKMHCILNGCKQTLKSLFADI